MIREKINSTPLALLIALSLIHSIANAATEPIKIFDASPDGSQRLIATDRADKKLNLLDTTNDFNLVLENKKGDRKPILAEMKIRAARFSPDGKWIAALQTGKELKTSSMAGPLLHVVLISISESEKPKFKSHDGIDGFSWDAASKRMIYWAPQQFDDADPPPALFWVDISELKEKPFMGGKKGSNARFSPDDSRVLYIHSERTEDGTRGTPHMVDLKSEKDTTLEQPKRSPLYSAVPELQPDRIPLWSASDVLVFVEDNSRPMGTWALNLKSNRIWRLSEEIGDLKWKKPNEEVELTTKKGTQVFNLAETEKKTGEPPREVLESSSDGSHLLVITKRNYVGAYDDEDFDTFDLHLETKGSADRRTLATDSNIQGAKFSPDGKWIAYQQVETRENCGCNQEGDNTRLHVVSVSDPSYQFKSSECSWDFLWSPTSLSLVHDGCKLDEKTGTPNQHTLVIDPAKKNEEELIGGKKAEGVIAFSPDGGRLLLTSNSESSSNPPLIMFDMNTRTELSVLPPKIPEKIIMPVRYWSCLWSKDDKLVWQTHEGVMAFDIKAKKLWKVSDDLGKVTWVKEGEQISIDTEKGPVAKSINP